MNKRSLLFRFSAAGMTATLALIVGATSAQAGGSSRPPYPHYEVYTFYENTPVQKYNLNQWEKGYEDRREGSNYNAVAICALNGQGGSRMVDLYKHTTGLPDPEDKYGYNLNRYYGAAPSDDDWTFFKTWQIPICGYTDYNGGNPFASNGGYDTGTGMGFGAYWFKVVAHDSTSPTMFCGGQSLKYRTDVVKRMHTTGKSCGLDRPHDKFFGSPEYDI